MLKLFGRNLINWFSKISIDTMPETGTISELYKRLQELKRQAASIQTQLTSIRGEIRNIEQSNVFLFLGETVDGSEPSNEVNNEGPPVKRKKYDFPRDEEYVVVYTDGACERNGRPDAKAGYGVWFGDNHPLNKSEPVTGKATNNVGEIQACIAAVEIAKANDFKKLKIKTDSQFVINSMTQWISGWKKRNWKLASGGEVKNIVDFKKLDLICKNMDIKWEYVSGHTGIEGNEKADELARQGARRYKP